MTKPYSRTFATLTVVALAGLATAGCSSSPSTPASGGSSTSKATDLSSVTLSVGDQKGTGAQALLQAAGLLKSLPFKVNWTDFVAGVPMLEAMASGSVDIGGVGDSPPVFAASGGEGVEIVGARETKGDQDALLVPKSSAVTSISQLRGKKIAVSVGSSASYHLISTLQKNGLSTKDVTIVNLPPAEALAAFTSGSVDAWDVWPPYAQQVEVENNARVLTVAGSYGSPYSFQVASKSALADPSKAAAIKVYLTELNKAYVWAAQHPSSWGTTWSAASGLPAKITNPAAVASETTPIPITGSIISSEQSLADTFYTAGMVPAKVSMSGYITSEFNGTVSGG
jgi:sulfonate transport system substrate-binding protein